MVKQSTISWSTSGGGQAVSVLHWSDATTPGVIALNVGSFLDALRPLLHNDTTAAGLGEVRQLDTATGQLIAVAGGAATTTRVGSGGANAVPNLAQGLIRFPTDGIVNGHRVRGRLFVPGMSLVTADPVGNVTSGAVIGLAAAGQAIRSGGYFSVYSRPFDGSETTPARVGTVWAAGPATGWSEFASQRGRRS